MQGVLGRHEHPRLAYVLVAVGVVCLLVPLLLFPLARRTIQVTPFHFAESKMATPDLGSFLLAYLLPLLALSLTKSGDLIIFFLLVLLVGILYTRANLVHVQPIYWVFGWHVYECKKKSGEFCWVLTKETLLPGDHQCRDLGGHVLVRNT